MTQPDADALSPDDQERDNQILRLRESGRTYLAIAERLGLERATAARSGYLRALRRLPPDERSASRLSELERLDSLARSISSRDDIDDTAIVRRLQMVARLRLDLDLDLDLDKQ